MSEAHSPLPHLKVLILDNSSDILELLSTDLQCRGCAVTTASVSAIRHGEIDGARLIEAAAPDVVVFDVALPYEANWRVAVDLQSDPRVRMPFVLTTTNALAVRRLIGRDLIELVGKPYDLDTLYSAIVRSVGSEIDITAPGPRSLDREGDRRSPSPDREGDRRSGSPDREGDRRSGHDRRTTVRRQAVNIEPEYL